jgi:hypothetical protein
MAREYSDLRRFLRSRWGIGVLAFLGTGGTAGPRAGAISQAGCSTTT